MTFLRESLKFITMSFMKKCRIIIRILVKIRGIYQTDTPESIISEMLVANLRWSFKTLITCIEKSKKPKDEMAQEVLHTANGNENEDTL